MEARVLVSAFGSAGDLFPLLPVVQRLREDGHDVRCALPRALGLYLRADSITTYSLGSGTELRVFADTRLVSTRFDGWHSWRHTVQDYVAPSLGQDVASLDRLLTGWRPDVVVTTSFAAAARLAAHRHGIPRLEVSIYPEQLARLGCSGSFARSYRALVAEQAAEEVENLDAAVVTDLAWGVNDRCVLLHDPTLLASLSVGRAAVGFPYFDAGPADPEAVAQAEAWLDRTDGPVVAVTSGSFLGVGQHQLWADAAEAVRSLGVRAIFVGPHRPGSLPVAPGPDTLVVGFVPLSRIAPRVTAVVHHGGIGTMFAALGAGRPAAVVPQAFDQTHNARLVEDAGVGVDATRTPLEKALRRLLEDQTLADGAEAVARLLVPAELAADRVVDLVLQRARNGPGT